MTYSEDEMLMLSGIQHFVFCPRQWALIHIDQQWHDNYLTIEGNFLHRNVDDPTYRAIVRGVAVLRHVSLTSKSLGIYGFSDLIELREADDQNNSIYFPKYNKYLVPYIIEYKHGKPKIDDCDIMQLVCQAMCLEGMYNITVTESAIYYMKTKRRLPVTITDELRLKAKNICDQMHRLYKMGKLPPPPETLSRCQKCSLIDICEPKVHTEQLASNYILNNLYEKTT